MGNQTSSTQPTPLISDRTVSSNFSSQSTNLAHSDYKACKTINVGSREQLNILKKSFDFRLKNRQYLAHLYGFEVGNIQQGNYFQKIGCKSAHLSTKITCYYDKITFKFADLYHIPIQEGVKLLSQCLKGFSLLYEHFGYFVPESRLIFKQGEQWKVWISENIFSTKNEIYEKGNQSQKVKLKFLQKVVHLFDLLRDQNYPGFSYSEFIYGANLTSKSIPIIDLNQILEKLNHITSIQHPVENPRYYLRKQSIASNETVRKIDGNSQISIEQRNNRSTMSKFRTNKNSSHKKSMTQPHPFSQIKQISQYNLNSQIQLKKQRKNNLSLQLSQTTQLERNEAFNFKKVPSKNIKQVQSNKNSIFKQNDPSKHLKKVSLSSNPTNCTNQTKDIKQLRMFGNFKQDLDITDKRFYKNQRSMTMDISCQNQFYEQKVQLITRKITQKSEGNSQSSDKNSKNHNFNHALIDCYFQAIQQNQQIQQLKTTTIISKNPSSKTPSIARKTRKYGKQTMKYLQQYLIGNLGGDHKRSLTDQGVVEQQNKIKFCWSQDFDSEFFSMDSRNEDPMTSNLEINDEITDEKTEQDSNVQEQTKIVEFQKKKKRVKIQNKENLKQRNSKKDQILQNSEIGEINQISKQTSLAKLAMFKSQCRLKNMLGSRLNTLKSIKQINFDFPLDEDILADLNKMFPKHRFARNSKIQN